MYLKNAATIDIQLTSVQQLLNNLYNYSNIVIIII